MPRSIRARVLLGSVLTILVLLAVVAAAVPGIATQHEIDVLGARLAAPRGSYLIAAEPAVLAAESLARGSDIPAGIVPAHAQVDPAALFARLRALGVDVRT